MHYIEEKNGRTDQWGTGGKGRDRRVRSKGIEEKKKQTEGRREEKEMKGRN